MVMMTTPLKSTTTTIKITMTVDYMYFVLRIINDGVYLTFKSIFNKVLNLFYFDFEIMCESLPETGALDSVV